MNRATELDSLWIASRAVSPLCMRTVIGGECEITRLKRSRETGVRLGAQQISQLRPRLTVVGDG